MSPIIHIEMASSSFFLEPIHGESFLDNSAQKSCSEPIALLIPPCSIWGDFRSLFKEFSTMIMYDRCNFNFTCGMLYFVKFISLEKPRPFIFVQSPFPLPVCHFCLSMKCQKCCLDGSEILVCGHMWSRHKVCLFLILKVVSKTNLILEF